MALYFFNSQLRCIGKCVCEYVYTLRIKQEFEYDKKSKLATAKRRLYYIGFTVSDHN